MGVCSCDRLLCIQCVLCILVYCKHCRALWLFPGTLGVISTSLSLSVSTSMLHNMTSHTHFLRAACG